MYERHQQEGSERERIGEQIDLTYTDEEQEDARMQPRRVIQPTEAATEKGKNTRAQAKERTRITMQQGQRRVHTQLEKHGHWRLREVEPDGQCFYRSMEGHHQQPCEYWDQKTKNQAQTGTTPITEKQIEEMAAHTQQHIIVWTYELTEGSRLDRTWETGLPGRREIHLLNWLREGQGVRFDWLEKRVHEEPEKRQTKTLETEKEGNRAKEEEEGSKEPSYSTQTEEVMTAEKVYKALRGLKRGRGVPEGQPAKEIPEMIIRALVDRQTRTSGKTQMGRRLMEIMQWAYEYQVGPQRWFDGEAAQVPKGNGKTKCDGIRTCTQLDGIGKAFYKLVWAQDANKRRRAIHAQGSYSKRRRENAMVTKRVVRWRLLKARRSHVERFFDVANAFPSPKHTSLDKTVEAVAPQESRLMRQRYRRARIWIKAYRIKRIYRIGCGTPQGDCPSPELFSESFAEPIRKFTQKRQERAKEDGVPPLIVGRVYLGGYKGHEDGQTG